MFARYEKKVCLVGEKKGKASFFEKRKKLLQFFLFFSICKENKEGTII